MNDDANEIYYASNYRINNNKTTTSKSFKCKTKISGSTPPDNSRLDAEVVVPSKYLSNVLRSFDLLLINCEIELNLRWTKNSIISEISIADAVAANSDNSDANPPVQAKE